MIRWVFGIIAVSLLQACPATCTESSDRQQLLAIGFIATEKKISPTHLVATEHASDFFKKSHFFTITHLASIPHQGWLVAVSDKRKKMLDRSSFPKFVKDFQTVLIGEPLRLKGARVVEYIREVLTLWQPSFVLLESTQQAIELFPDQQGAIEKVTISKISVSPRKKTGNLDVAFFGSPYWGQIWRFSFIMNPKGGFDSVATRPVIKTKIPIQ